MNNKPLVIYHKNCLDGFGAAYAFWLKQGDNFEYLAASYQDTPPDVTNRQVFILDFSYKREVIKSMLESAAHITWIDHHQSAIDDLAGFSDELIKENGYSNFTDLSDNTRSGAALAWLFCNKETDPRWLPDLFKTIEDNDLWKFELPNTKEIIAYLYSLPFDFEEWYILRRKCITSEIIPIGQAILRARQKQIDEILINVCESIEQYGFSVLIANCPKQLASDVGAELAKGRLYSVTYCDNKTHREYSLRSRSDEKQSVDVSLIAKTFGGGGHKNAAGFTVKLNNNLFRVVA